MRAARTPPEPAPMTNRSTSDIADPFNPKCHRTAVGKCAASELAPLFQLVAKPVGDFLAKFLTPGFGAFQSFRLDRFALLFELDADRRFIEGEHVLELFFGETGRKRLDQLISELETAWEIFLDQHVVDFGHVLLDLGIG